ncbi:hypothetical protein GCM10010439_03510 [Actinocorallia aurantiaca]|uniref:Uncharacterized protein n=1 Tax=Actinocorallia aurantiaca TaxID=46204 RepID=A0ABN3TUX0_9ACTN
MGDGQFQGDGGRGAARDDQAPEEGGGPGGEDERGSEPFQEVEAGREGAGAVGGERTVVGRLGGEELWLRHGSTMCRWKARQGAESDSVDCSVRVSAR